MCGIAGELSFTEAKADPAGVKRMMDRMHGRGPDDEGLWARNWVAFGHRRLKIIDLSDAGAQPMIDEELGLAIVFNGCIYNHAQLREQLQERYHFTSSSDTEVILKAYAHWGEDFVDHLVGMFAIVLFDERRNRVVLARDRLGIKPLYLAQTPDRLRFASTLPGLLAAGDIDTELDPVALHHYLSWHSIVPAPRTVLRGVRKLPPATVRVIEHDGAMRDRVYWHLDYARDSSHTDWNRADWIDAVHDALRTAVKRRMVADVPVGVLLSGGLDSSLLVGLVDEIGVEGLKTFSIGFDSVGDAQGDEFVYSDAIAQHFGTDHHQLHVPGGDLAHTVPDVIDAMTEPMASHDVTAFYLLSQAVSQHVSVVQSGQGADELFAGYSYHQAAAGVAHTEALDVFTEVFRDRSHAAVTAMLSEERTTGHDASSELLERRIEAGDTDTALDAVLHLDTHTLMVDDPVKRVDNMSMAWGLEARVPFLDHDLVELAAKCPPEFKTMQGGKGVLKDLGRRLIPDEVIDRPKGYFPVPGFRHLQGDVLDMVHEALTNSAARNRGLFRPEAIDRLLVEPNRHTDGPGGNPLWSLAVLEMWLQHHVSV